MIMRRMGYTERIAQAARLLGIDNLKGKVTDASIQHDAGCALLLRAGACDCVPDITLNTGAACFAVDGIGRVRRINTNSRGARYGQHRN